MSEMRKFYEAVFKESMPDIQIKEFQDSSHSQYGHRCSTRCSLHFPLQKDGNICGVVAAVMLAMSCLLPEFFQFVFSCKRKQEDTESKLFFSNPTKYDKYLRQVLAAWLAEDCVSMKYLVSSDFLTGKLPCNPTDTMEKQEEQSDIILVEFEAQTASLDTGLQGIPHASTEMSNQSSFLPMANDLPAAAIKSSLPASKKEESKSVNSQAKIECTHFTFSTNRRGVQETWRRSSQIS